MATGHTCVGHMAEIIRLLCCLSSTYTSSSLSPSQDGVHYHFISKDEFEHDIADGKFLEYAYVHDNIYGTSIKAVKDVAVQGKCCILDIDVQGARQVRASNLRAIFVFIAPPSLEELERRLRGRGTESEEQIATRLKNAREEVASMEEPGLYDYCLINNDVETCLKELRTIANRALAGEVGPPVPDSARTASTRGEPLSATASLRGWLGGPGSPDALSEANITSLAAPGSVPSPLARWRGAVALVTGATADVGRAISLSLASAGLRVVAVSRKKAELEALQEAAQSSGILLSDFLPIVCDLTKEAEVVALPRIVAKRWPGTGIDILVNAAVGWTAGAPGEAGSLMVGNTGAWVEAVGVNILGTAMVTREVVSEMRRRGEWGHVLGVVPLVEEADGGGMAAVTYGSVQAMLQGLKREATAAGVPLRVSCVRVGAVQTGEGGGADKLSPGDVTAAVAWCLGAAAQVDVAEVVVKSTGPSGPIGGPPGRT